ncbi:MAG: cytochrome C, partial [Aquimonas sp.]|nr:cytochrome C [Aquimonas sp.]
MKRQLDRGRLFLWFALLFCGGLWAATPGGGKKEFDHATTGYILSGAHQSAACEGCHQNGILKGTPKACASCHGPSARIQATPWPGGHIQTLATCDTCHQMKAWLPARFDHGSLGNERCSSCHNGNTARGKPSDHPNTNADCATCHRTTAWTPARFDHSQVSPGQCASCHNGDGAEGKPAGHITTTASCDSCHLTTAWTPATFNHNNVTAGTCTTCHNGTTAT